MALPHIAGNDIIATFSVFDWESELPVTDISTWSVRYSKRPGGTITPTVTHLGSGIYQVTFTPPSGSEGDHHLWIYGTSPTTGRTYNAANSWRVVTDAITPSWYSNIAIEVLFVVVDYLGAPVATAPTQISSDDPDGNSFVVTIAATATTGAYLGTFTPDEAGNWSASFSAAVTPIRGYSIDYDVTDPGSIAAADTVAAVLTRTRVGESTSNTVRRGDTCVWEWQIDKADESVFSLIGCTLWFSIKSISSLDDDDSEISHYWVHGGSSSGIACSLPLTGYAVHTISAAESAVLPVGSVHYDIQLKDSNGVITTLESSSISVLEDITQRTTTP